MQRRLPYLDALRGFAALAVLIQHIAERIIAAGPAGGSAAGAALFVDAFNFGRFGVALFFLISGFVIPFSFKGERPLRGFAISRFFRLYPAYWLSLATGLLVHAHVGAPPPGAETLLANITMFQHFVGQPDVVPAYWTLAIELIFYILCAALFGARALARPGVIAATIGIFLLLATALASAAAISGRHLPANIALNLAFMFLGTLLRRARLEADPRAGVLLPWTIAAVALAAPLVEMLSYAEATPGDFPISPVAFTAAYLTALALFVACVLNPRDFGRTAAWFGAISYAIYLFHGPMLTLFAGLLAPGVPLGGVGYAVAVAASTVAISAAVFYGVERPCIDLGHRLMRRDRSLDAATPASAR